MIARLEIADFYGFARGADVFGRTRGLDGRNRLIVGLDDDVVVFDLPQDPGNAADAIGLIVAAAARRLAGLLSALGIPATAAGIGTVWTTARIPAAGIPNAGNNDLAKCRNTGQD